MDTSIRHALDRVPARERGPILTEATADAAAACPDIGHHIEGLQYYVNRRGFGASAARELLVVLACFMEDNDIWKGVFLSGKKSI